MKEENLYDALIVLEKDGSYKIYGNINLNESILEKIKEKNCGLLEIDGVYYCIFRKGNKIVLNRFECITDILKEYEEKAIYDPLTGCFNKGETQTFLKKLLANYIRYRKEPFSIIMIDVDFFKKINDTYGHLAGDYILKEIANIIKNNIRESDICGRFGGEEFIIILPNTKLAGAIKTAERLREAIEKHKFRFERKDIKVTASFGVTSSGINDSIESLISRADEALYEAKRKGRNRVEFK